MIKTQMVTMTKLKNDEVLNDLLGFKNMKIIQNPKMFNFSLDSTLLAYFAPANHHTKRILDLGTGFAPVPLMLSQKTKATIIGVELQDEVFDIAKRNIDLNNLNHQITIIQDDIKNLTTRFDKKSFDLIVCNPPFFKYQENSNINKNQYKTIARHELKIKLKEVIETASKLLIDNGRFTMVHRPERLSEIIFHLSANHLTIKRLRYVHPRPHEDAMMILIDCKKHGNTGLKVLPPLFVHENNDYSKEAKAIFNNERV